MADLYLLTILSQHLLFIHFLPTCLRQFSSTVVCLLHDAMIQPILKGSTHYGIASRCSHSGIMCVSYESHGLWKQRCKGHGQRFAICTTTHAQKCDMTIVLLCRCALHCQSSHSKHNGFVCWHWRFGHKCTVYNHCSDCTWKHEMQSHHTGRTVHTLWNLVATFCYVSEDCLKATVDHWDQCSRLQRSA